MVKRNHNMIKSAVLLSGLVLAAQAAETSAEKLAQAEARVDSLAEYAASTVIGKDDAPVSMSGSVTTRLRNFQFDKYSPLYATDKARSFVDANLDIALGVTPNSYVNFWTILNFPFDFSGYFTNSKLGEPYESPNYAGEKVPTHHHADYYSATLWEDVTAGIDVRGGSFGAMLKAGGVLWANSSPLTIWEREAWPKFPSTFETFEEERTVSTYYKEKTFRPVSEGGRAFWTNRSFGGLLMEVYQMPFGLSGQLMLAQPKDNDYGTRDGLRLLAGQPGELEMSGTLDYRGDVVHGRLAKKDIGTMSVGVNYLGLFTDRGVVYEPGFVGTFSKNPYLTDFHVGSVDVKGNITPSLYMLLDMAVSMDDSTLFVRQDSTLGLSSKYDEETYSKSKSKPAPAIYAKVQSKYGIPLTTELSFIDDDFYSPYGMTDYSRNRLWRKDVMSLGAGAYRYSPNLMGVNVKVEPAFDRGRFNVMYSQHRQYKAGKDVIVFPYRLNGRQMSETSLAWSKYNTALLFDEAAGASSQDRYKVRLGGTKGLKMEDASGGLRGGSWELWEFFGAFETVSQASTLNVPEHAKWSNVLSIDMGYDIGNWFGTDRNIMLAANTSISGVSKNVMPLAVSAEQDGMLLWNFFFQAEPAMAITPTLHGLLIAGVETFRSEMAYSRTDAATVAYYEQLPINYLQTALGFGFDWDFAPRAGLHVRYKRATHSDETKPENDWKAHFVTAETKVWF